MTDASWQPTCSLAALKARSDMLWRIRAFFAERRVLEVQTPVLGECTVTDPHIDSLRLDDGRFLQTSPEFYLKRLLAAGAPAHYQIGPAFRSGESGRQHRPEFMLLEWYRPGFDDDALMDEVSALIDAVLGPANADDYARLPWKSLTGVLTGEPEEMDIRYAEAVRKLPPGRCFVVDFPPSEAALARLRQDGEPRAARFELIVDGIEIANGYHELTDAEELRARMAKDNQRRAAMGKAQVAPDERLLAAMAAGLPDCAGVAVGLDRLLMLALQASNIAEVMTFADG